MLNASKQKTNAELVDLLYDKNSSDPVFNWGKTGGIQDNVVVTNKDFSKYKKLVVHGQAYAQNFTGIIDLTQPTTSDDYRGLNISSMSWDTSGLGMLAFICGGIVNSAKTSFQSIVHFIRVSNGATGATTAYFIYRIEGIYGGRRKLSFLHRIFHRGGAVC